MGAPESVSRDLWARRVDLGLQAVLWTNVIFLPVAGVSAVREWCLGLGLLLFLLRSGLTGRWRLAPTPMWPWLLAFTLCIAVSVVFALDPRYSLRQFRGQWLKGLAWFYLTVLAVDEDWKVKGMLAALWAGAAVMIGYGVVHSVFSPNWRTLMALEPSLAAGVGTLSTYLIQVWPFLFLLPLARPGRWSRVGAVLLVLGALYLMAMSSQRAVWLAMLVVGPLSFGVLLKRWRWTAVAALGLVLVFVIGVLVLPSRIWVRGDEVGRESGPGRIAKVVTHPGALVGRRGQVWQAAWGLALDYPLTGVGYGRAALRLGAEIFSRYPTYWHAHNTFLNVAGGTGLTGLVAFVGLVLALLWFAFRRWRAGPGFSSSVGGAALLMMLGFWGRNWFNDFFVDDAALLFWILAALAFVPAFSQNQRAGTKPAPASRAPQAPSAAPR